MPDTALGKWMRAVVGISRAVTNEQPLEAILTKVAEHARELIGFDFCAVMLADGDHLEIVGRSGLSHDYLRHLSDNQSLRIDPIEPAGDSPAARAYRESRTITISDVSRSAARYGRLSIASMQGYASLVASPISAAHNTIGVLVGYSVQSRTYNSSEVELSDLLAEQTATAIGSARLRAQQRVAIENLSVLNEELKIRQNELEWAGDQHRVLMNLALDRIGLDGLVTALARILCSTVSVVGHEGEVLAGACGSTADSPAPGNDSPNPVVIRAFEAEKITFRAPIIVDGAPAGELRIHGDDIGAHPGHQRLVEQFALVVGFKMLTERYVLEVEERLSGELFADLLRPDSPRRSRTLAERSSALGFDLSQARNLVLISSASTPNRQPSAMRMVRDSVRVPLMLATHNDDIVVLTSATKDLAVRLGQLLKDLETRLETPVTVVIGTTIAEIGEILTSYRAATVAAHLGSATNQTALIDLRDWSPLTLLLMTEIPTPRLAQLAEGIVGPLAAHDARRDAHLVATLRAWLAAGFSIAETARRLVVHVNTVSYRLERIERLMGRDLSLADTRLEAQLAVHIWDVMQAQPAP
jgi:sugar diacid utilization regulator